jgi:N-acetylmuramic acid 6-phosphate etherase
MPTESIRQAAEHFIKNETPFHLGDMLTEQSHPVTRRLSQTLDENTAEGIELLLRVDDDIPPVLDRVLASPQFAKLQTDIHETLRNSGRIIFSGCGATGRLAILLDAAHRKFCAKTAARFPQHRDFFQTLHEQTAAIMTGGDFALIRSVESFEDYISFGQRQTQDIGMGPSDCLVAISEGGETSSVIGTIHGALAAGSRTHFLFNNPAGLLVRKVERSRNVITDPRVNTLDLSTGPMAVAGSTRMQATTIELLIAGLAFESALFDFLSERLPASSPALQAIFPSKPSPAESAARFRQLLLQIRAPENIRALAAWVDYERDIYAQSGLITYFPCEHTIDIFTDTTERSPTFKIPPFRSTLEPAGDPVSWAFVKDPLRDTPTAWRNLLGHEPRCIEWTPGDYRAMNAAERIIQNPPKIDWSRLSTYLIGNEPDPTRTAARPNAAIAFLIGDEAAHLETRETHTEWRQTYDRAAAAFERRAAIVIGSQRPAAPAANPPGEIFFIAADIPSSPLELSAHLAAKLALNNVSTATMSKLGRLTGNWMAHVDASNKKLIDRSIRLVSELAAVDYKTACHALFETLDEMTAWPESRRKTVSPAAHTVKRLRAGV